jgi:biofilm PGA synthesis lipoprotein PgaB
LENKAIQLATRIKRKTLKMRSFCILCALLICVTAKGDQSAVVSVYHHVSNSTPPSTSLSPEAFRAHLTFLAENDFTVLPVTEIINELNRGGELPSKSVAITFDDGYESIYSTAFPLLQEFGFPFSVFVSTGPIDRQQAGYMTWEHLSMLRDAGVIIGNHGTEHRSMLGQSRDEARADILDAQSRITAELGPQPHLFAYPYGEYSNESKEIIAELGFVGFAQNSGAIGPTTDQTALPRFPLAGLYAGLEGAALKYSTRAFDAEMTLPLSAETRLSAPSATIRFGAGAYSRERLTCFDEGEPMAISWEKTGEGSEQAVISTTQRERGRRWNYVCTAPHRDQGRYFWFSQPWFDSSKPL